MKQDRYLPEQEKGLSKDFERSIVMDHAVQAREVFRIVSERLRSINEWDKYTGMLSARFTLTDQQGTEVHRMAMPGDYVRIDAPGPSLSVDKFDWVHVHAIKDIQDVLRDEDVFDLELRPAPAPDGDGKDVAHFFDDHASGSFVLMRQHRKITLSYHGRNERPNLGISHMRDKLRNLLMGVVAATGIADRQWHTLIKGLLDADH